MSKNAQMWLFNTKTTSLDLGNTEIQVDDSFTSAVSDDNVVSSLEEPLILKEEDDNSVEALVMKEEDDN